MKENIQKTKMEIYNYQEWRGMAFAIFYKNPSEGLDLGERVVYDSYCSGSRPSQSSQNPFNSMLASLAYILFGQKNNVSYESTLRVLS